MQKSTLKLILVILCMGSGAQAFAQAGYGFAKKVGDADFYPAVRVEYFSNNNTFLSNAGETESSSVAVSPSFLLIANTGKFSVEAEYSGTYSNNADVSTASFADHNLNFESSAELSKRFRTGAQLRLEFNHQGLGTRYTEDIADSDTDAVTYTNTLLHLYGNYGASQAKGNVELGLDIGSLNFTNQPQLTAGDDYSIVEPYGVFSYRLSPDLRALAELRFGTTSYDDSVQDRTDLTALFGVSIAATGKLDGEIKIGSTMSNYDNNTVPDETELAVRTRLNYIPVDYSRFSFEFIRGIDQFNDNAGDANGAAVISDVLRVGWTHQWSSRFFHRALLTRNSVDRDCPSENVVTNSASYELNLRYRRWLEFGVGANSVVKEAQSCNETIAPSLDYDQTRFGVHMRATL